MIVWTLRQVSKARTRWRSFSPSEVLNKLPTLDGGEFIPPDASVIIKIVFARTRWRSFSPSEVLNKLPTLDGGEFIPPNASESDHELELLFTLDGSAFQRPDAMSVIL